MMIYILFANEKFINHSSHNDFQKKIQFLNSKLITHNIFIYKVYTSTLKRCLKVIFFEKFQPYKKMLSEIAAKLASNPDREQVAKSVFDSFDTNSSGRIEKAELKVAMNKIGTELGQGELSDEQFERGWAKMDQDANGTLDFEEFKVMIMGLFNALASE